MYVHRAECVYVSTHVCMQSGGSHGSPSRARDARRVRLAFATAAARDGEGTLVHLPSSAFRVRSQLDSQHNFLCILSTASVCPSHAGSTLHDSTVTTPSCEANQKNLRPTHLRYTGTYVDS